MTLLLFISFGIGLVEVLIGKHITTKLLKRFNTSIGVILIFITIVIIAGGSTQNPDTVVYQRIYEMQFYSKNIGFGFLIYLCKSLGISLEALRLLLTFISICLINHVVKKHLNPRYQILFYSLYLLFPFFLDVTQIRNYIGMAILIFSFDSFEKNNVVEKTKFVIRLLIASSLQSVFVVYIPFILIHNVNKSKAWKCILAFAATVTVVFLSNKETTTKLALYLNSILSDYVSDISYYLNQSNNFGGYVYWLLTFINIFILYYCIKALKAFSSINTDKAISFAYRVYWLNIYCILFLPLTLITIDFYRIQRNLQLLNYIVIIMTVSKMTNKKKHQVTQIIVLSTAIMVIYTLYWAFIRDGNIERIVNPIITYNWIIGL